MVWLSPDVGGPRGQGCRGVGAWASVRMDTSSSITDNVPGGLATGRHVPFQYSKPREPRQGGCSFVNSHPRTHGTQNATLSLCTWPKSWKDDPGGKDPRKISGPALFFRTLLSAGRDVKTQRGKWLSHPGQRAWGFPASHTTHLQGTAAACGPHGFGEGRQRPEGAHR